MNRILVVSILLAKNSRVRNSFNLLKKSGNLRCRNGYVLKFDNGNFRDVKNLFVFSQFYGVNFSTSPGYWNYNEGIITTPEGIRFKVNMFDPLIFSETFLCDIHFSGFNLYEKTVVQAGGFIGDTALYYASKKANVYSFEPDVNSYSLAIENIKLNPEFSKHIVMKNYAIGEDKDILFPINPGGSGGSSAYNIENQKTVKVRSVSISTILDEFQIENPFLLDLDIKGKELDIVKDKAISRFEEVRIEYSTSIDGVQLYEREYIIQNLKEAVFTRFRIYKHNELRYDLMEHGTIEATR